MGDDRYCFLHVSDSLSGHLLDVEDEQLGWNLPDDDVQVPMHLLPPYQDEDDESVLPSASHPSYPYGNPYAPRALSNNDPSAPSSASNAHPTLPSSFNSASFHSLATTLPVLALPHLFELTTFASARDRRWGELGLDALLDKRERLHGEDEYGAGGRSGGVHRRATAAGAALAGDGGEAPQPTGQNAGDHPPDEEDEGMLMGDDD